jgi:ABC-type phosphate transport system auxiliary subunit
LYSAAKASSVKELRDKITEVELQDELKESLSFPIDLLHSQMGRLKLKDKPFQTFSPASDEDIQALWDRCLEIENRLQVLDHKHCCSIKQCPIIILANITQFFLSSLTCSI